MSYKQRAFDLLNKEYDRFRGVSRAEAKKLNEKMPIKYSEIKEYFARLNQGDSAKDIFNDVKSKIDLGFADITVEDIKRSCRLNKRC